MRSNTNSHRYGRAGVASLLGLTALVGGGTLLFARKAHAQSTGSQPIVLTPSVIQAIGSGQQGITRLSVQAWLPAVQRGDTPFSIRVDMGDGSVAVLQNPPEAVRSMVSYEIFLSGDERAGYRVHIRNQATGVEATAATTSHLIDPCWLPGSNTDGPLRPMSLGETFQGSQNVRSADGSVAPIPFQYGLQAPTG